MIEANLFFDDFRNEFIDADEITIDAQTNFRTLDSWDSLTGMAILVMIQDKYTNKFTETDFKACNNVGDVYDAVQKYINE